MMFCGVDIGGTLAKAAVFVQDSSDLSRKAQEHEKAAARLRSSAWLEEELSMEVRGGTVLFLKFLTSQAHKARESIEQLGVIPKGTPVCSTGGGAFKLEDEIKRLGVAFSRHDEMETLIVGLRIFATIPGETFTLKNIHFAKQVGPNRLQLNPRPTQLHSTSFVVCNIGSGVSFIHVTESGFSRIGGSSLGGSTFLGLVSLLTGTREFDRAINLASAGDSTKVDLLVRDVYGEGKGVYGLRPTTLAASFGKAINKKNHKRIKNEDLALSCLVMISMNVAAIAHLHAKSVNADHIVFTGNFLAQSGKNNIKRTAKLGLSSELHLHKRNSIAMRTLAYAVDFWSNGKTQSLFFKHEGYLGAVGALVLGSKNGEVSFGPLKEPSDFFVRSKI